MIYRALFGHRPSLICHSVNTTRPGLHSRYEAGKPPQDELNNSKVQIFYS